MPAARPKIRSLFVGQPVDRKVVWLKLRTKPKIVVPLLNRFVLRAKDEIQGDGTKEAATSAS